MLLQMLEEDGNREQAGAQTELARMTSQQAANDAARRKLEQQLKAAHEETNRLQAVHTSALNNSQSQVISAYKAVVLETGGTGYKLVGSPLWHDLVSLVRRSREFPR